MIYRFDHAYCYSKRCTHLHVICWTFPSFNLLGLFHFVLCNVLELLKPKHSFSPRWWGQTILLLLLVHRISINIHLSVSYESVILQRYQTLNHNYQENGCFNALIKSFGQLVEFWRCNPNFCNQMELNREVAFLSLYNV